MHVMLACIFDACKHIYATNSITTPSLGIFQQCNRISCRLTNTTAGQSGRKCKGVMLWKLQGMILSEPLKSMWKLHIVRSKESSWRHSGREQYPLHRHADCSSEGDPCFVVRHFARCGTLLWPDCGDLMPNLCPLAPHRVMVSSSVLQTNFRSTSHSVWGDANGQKPSLEAIYH